MKKIYFLIFILIAFSNCKEDDEIVSQEDVIKFTEDGLQVGIPAIVNDTIVRNDNMNIELLNANEEDIVISNIYELKLEGGSFSRVQKGTTIIDNRDGRLWVVTEIIENANNQIRVNAFPGLLGNLFQNAIIKASFNENRAKENSDYPNKLTSNQVTLKAFDQDFLWEINDNNTNSSTLEVADGASVSTDEDGNVIIEFNDFKILDLNGSNIKITQGTATLNGAFDAEMKFNPIETLLGAGNPLAIQAGAIKDFKSAVYLSADFDVTFGGEFDLIEFDEFLPLTNHIFVIPVGCCAFIELELDVIIRATVNLSSEFTLTPNYVNKNDFVGISSYQGLGSIPTLDYEFENLENTATINDTYNVDAGIKLEFVPKASIYLYGLIGPSAELIPYIELTAEAQIDGASNTTTWNAGIDYGIDSNLYLDINVLGNTTWIENNEIGVQPLITLSESNIFEEILYNVPQNSLVISGNNQTSEINTTLENPIIITIKDNLENGVSGVTVFFETQGNSGSYEEAFLTTDDNGIVQNTWNLGSTVGTQTSIVYAKDGNGEIISSTQIEITANGNNSDSILPAQNPNPDDGATNVEINGTLSFTEGANTPADATFRILFDQNPNPSFEYNLSVGETSLPFNNLNPSSQYYWQVQTISNSNEVLAVSPIWSFTTEGSNMTVTDIDGNVYQTVQIGNQIWMAENLKTTRFKNGDVIPTGLTDSELQNTNEPAYVTLDEELYGHHYNWFTISDIRGLCPEGFRVPNVEDVNELNSFVQGDGGKLKSTSDLWISPNNGATNDSGFTAEPAGRFRYFPPAFDGVGSEADFWTSVETSTAGAISFGLLNVNTNININQNIIKVALESCRCIEE